jgi:release factor glutamine methyltransferase
MRDQVGEPARRPGAPSRGEVLRGIAAELEAAGLDSPLVEAERLLSHVLGIPRRDLVLSAGERLDPEAAGALADAVARRLDHEPLQHIEGSTAFRELILVADGRALIPRPETEELVDRVGSWLGKRAPVQQALDIGTGSGAIALSLLREGLAERVLGLDASPEAMAQAKENAALSGVVEDRLELRLCPVTIWPALDPSEQFDLIVSNPPYVEESEVARLPAEIRRFEPRSALIGGVDGLEVIRTIIQGACAHLAPGAALFLEIGEGQGSAVQALLENARIFDSISIDSDLAGRDRFAFGRRREGSKARG